ncbi:MAG: hypothetical protein PHZ16_05050, partial [Eubacteriales bacterium]|nr:hypothetical protein [Eubacteriales bacterium]
AIPIPTSVGCAFWIISSAFLLASSINCIIYLLSSYIPWIRDGLYLDPFNLLSSDDIFLSPPAEGFH